MSRTKKIAYVPGKEDALVQDMRCPVCSLTVERDEFVKLTKVGVCPSCMTGRTKDFTVTWQMSPWDVEKRNKSMKRGDQDGSRSGEEFKGKE